MPDVSDWKTLDERVNEWLLRSFDLYIKHRERIYKIRMGEFKRRSEKLMERLGFNLDSMESGDNGHTS